MTYFDTHAHLDDETFEADRQAVIQRAVEAEVEAIICPAVTAGSSQQAVRLAETHALVYAAVGIQPNYCAEAAPGDWRRIEALADHPRVVAVGETGLDRHWDFTPFELQKEFFERHLRLAAERELPVVIHCRQAETDVLAVLGRAASRGPVRGVLHAFSGDADWAARCVELGLYVSFAGAVTYRNEKFEPLRRAAAAVAEDRLLVETDSPYLVPEPLRGRQKRNEPAQIVHTLRRLAQLRGQSVEQVAALTAANARRLFGLE